VLACLVVPAQLSHRADPDMKPTDIRVAMIEQKLSVSLRLPEIGVNPAAVFLVNENRAVSHRIRTKIAEHIGLDVHKVRPNPHNNGEPGKAGKPSKAKARSTS